MMPRGWLSDALGYPLVALGRYIAGESPASADPLADSLRVKRAKGTPINLIGTPAAPVSLGSSLATNRTPVVAVTDADYVAWFIQGRTATDTTGAAVGFAMEASYDAADWYPVPLLFTDAMDGSGPSGAAPTPAAIYVADTGAAAAPDGIGLSNAANTFQRMALYDVLVRPIVAVSPADDISIKWVVPTFVGAYSFVRGVLIPLYTGGGAITGSVVAVKVS